MPAGGPHHALDALVCPCGECRGCLCVWRGGGWGVRGITACGSLAPRTVPVFAMPCRYAPGKNKCCATCVIDCGFPRVLRQLWQLWQLWQLRAHVKPASRMAARASAGGGLRTPRSHPPTASDPTSVSSLGQRCRRASVCASALGSCPLAWFLDSCTHCLKHNDVIIRTPSIPCKSPVCVHVMNAAARVSVCVPACFVLGLAATARGDAGGAGVFAPVKGPSHP